MECYCDTGDPPDFYCEVFRKARKEHRCYECGRTILPREKYSDLRASWDGEPRTIRTCHGCTEIRDALSEMDCFCWLHGSLKEDVRMQFEEAYFSPGLRFAYLRIVSKYWSNK